MDRFEAHNDYNRIYLGCLDFPWIVLLFEVEFPDPKIKCWLSILAGFDLLYTWILRENNNLHELLRRFHIKSASVYRRKILYSLITHKETSMLSIRDDCDKLQGFHKSILFWKYIMVFDMNAVMWYLQLVFLRIKYYIFLWKFLFHPDNHQLYEYLIVLIDRPLHESSLVSTLSLMQLHLLCLNHQDVKVLPLDFPCVLCTQYCTLLHYHFQYTKLRVEYCTWFKPYEYLCHFIFWYSGGEFSLIDIKYTRCS